MGHHSNALFKYENPSLDQQFKVGEILGPAQRLDVNKTDFLFGELDCEIPDDVLCDNCKASKTLTRSVFNNCTINIIQKESLN